MLHIPLNRARFRWRSVAGSAGVLALAAGAGILLSLLAGPAIGSGQRRAIIAPPDARIDATHLPPLLRLPDEKATLRYDIACGTDDDGVCQGSGTVYVRSGNSGPYQALPLATDPQSPEGRYFADVPATITSSPSGFTYYAVLRDDGTGVATTLPAGGADAPEQSLPLASPTIVDLGTHRFGNVRAADARVASAAWGDGPGNVGLEGGPQEAPIGGSSFDVGADGIVSVLDEAHHRVLRFSGGFASTLPLQIDGTLADMSVASDGTIYVLESTGHGAPTPLIRSFRADGTPIGTWHTAERTASTIRIGPAGPVTLQYPSSQWMQVASAGAALTGDEQAQQGAAGQPLPGGGGSVVVDRLRDGSELRVAVVGSAGVAQAWRIRSDTPIGEVQLAQPLGTRLVVVFATYTDSASEFEALVLDGNGIVKALALPAAEWAETAPVSRFRLVGSSLYELGSTPSGVFVDRYDLGVS